MKCNPGLYLHFKLDKPQTVSIVWEDRLCEPLYLPVSLKSLCVRLVPL